MSLLLRTQLNDSIKSYDIPRISALLPKMDEEAMNKKINGMPQLHWACQKVKHYYDQDQAAKTLDLLLAKPGIDVNAKSEGGFTPVHTAIQNYNLPALEKLLICPGIDVNLKSDSGYAPLHTACEQRNYIVVEKLLACQDIDVNAKTNGGRTPLDIAFETSSWYYWKTLHMLLDSQGIDLHTKDHNGATLLHKACKVDSYELVKKVLAIPGIDVNAKDNFGNTPIIPTREKDPLVFGVMLEDPRVNLNIKDGDGDGLEEVICKLYTSSEKREECLKMLKSERMRRERRMIWIF